MSVLLAGTCIIALPVAFIASLMSLLDVFPALIERPPSLSSEQYICLRYESCKFSSGFISARPWYHGTDAARGGGADH